jgi:hypothetical protein
LYLISAECNGWALVTESKSKTWNVIL